MDWLSSLFDGFSEFFSGDIFGFDVMDIVTSAGINAVVAGISGGDIGEAALYGAAGGALKDAEFMGDYGNLAGTALQGYGLDKSLGGDGLIGGLGGAALSLLQGNGGTETGSQGESSTQHNNVAQNGVSSIVAGEEDLKRGLGGGGLLDILKPNADGSYSTVAKALLGAAGGYADTENQKDILEAAAKLNRESDQFNSDLKKDEYSYADESDFNRKMNNIARFG